MHLLIVNLRAKPIYSSGNMYIFLWTLWHFGNDNKVRVGYHDTPTYCLSVSVIRMSWKPVLALSFLHSWRIRSRSLLWACLKNATFEDVCLSLLSAPGVQFNRKLWLDSKLRIQIFQILCSSNILVVCQGIGVVSDWKIFLSILNSFYWIASLLLAWLSRELYDSSPPSPAVAASSAL